jgi:putative ABC transport system substrate-binding protein
MKRRELMLLLLGAAIIAPSRTLRAQQKPMPVVGFLSAFSPGPNPLGTGPYAQGLKETGYTYGQNVAIEYRWAEGNYDRLPTLAADLVSLTVDVIITDGGTPAALAAKRATSTIPIVFTTVSDPIGVGLVAGLARPGGNATGFSNIAAGLTPKLLDLISEAVPHAGLIALLVNPKNPIAAPMVEDVREAARGKEIKIAVLNASTESEIDAAFAALGQLQVRALVVDPDSLFVGQRRQVVALASRYAVPAIYAHRQLVAAGGLISYGIDDAAANRQAGIYAGRILNGTKPADLPVQQPTKFELVINLKTAQALGLTVPPSILARADEVIE